MDYRQNNIHIKVPKLINQGLFLIVEDEHTKNTLALTFEELKDIVELGTRVMIDNDPEIKKVEEGLLDWKLAEEEFEKRNRQQLLELKKMAEEELDTPNRSHIESLATVCEIVNHIDKLLEG